MNDPFDDWRNRWSQLFISDGKWQIVVPTNDGTVGKRPWHWWNPAHLARRVIHELWVRKYW